MINAGVSGDTTDSALARLEQNVLSRDPRIVMVGLGGNDYLQGVTMATTEANLRSIVRNVQSGGAMVVLLGFRFPSLNADYERMYETVGRDEHCFLVPNVLRGILADASLESDGVHPNARGYRLMAERVAGPLKTLLRKADAKRLR